MQSKEAKLEIVQHSRSKWGDAELDKISSIVWPQAWHHNKVSDELWSEMLRKYPDFRFVCTSEGNCFACSKLSKAEAEKSKNGRC